ncbi:MAG TPA: DNA-processing protein DprA [Candidatus Limnocylindrales bacterium]|nr:DNA-processing protein DprA [Candidatus Limnocylindrales bacterium]
MLDRGQPGYPELLAEIPDPPDRLYLRGVMPAGVMIAIVGSRRATPYGLRVAQTLARDFVRAGAVVVSGLARGIDAAAHEGAIEGGGKTVAVLATGLDPVYPPEHTALADRVARHGALLSEVPDGTVPLPGRFPIRNRIISGLSRGLVIVEAAARSGALITARMALEQGREVFAVPGSIENPMTAGTHALIQDGAALVQSAEDVLRVMGELPLVHAHTRARVRASAGPREPELAAVWELLDWVEPRHHDELAALLGLPVQEVSRRLTLLEMGNYIIGDCGAVTRRPHMS